VLDLSAMEPAESSGGGRLAVDLQSFEV